jgi:hypothetical protein
MNGEKKTSAKNEKESEKKRKNEKEKKVVFSSQVISFLPQPILIIAPFPLSNSRKTSSDHAKIEK